jgi:general secretion pathway protein B
MSYILDALRRADAERERGGVPGLHAQPFPPTSADAASADRRSVPWRWIGLGAAFGLAVPLALWMLGGDEAQRPSPVPQAIAPAPVPPRAAAPEPAPPVTAATPAIVAAAPSPPSPPMHPAAPPTADAPMPRKPAPAAAAKAGASPAQRTSTADAAPQADARITPIGELPDAIRRQLPPLQIGGSMYSVEPSSRMLIVNGQLLHERSNVAPGLVLEQIRLKSAVFGFQGHRFEITY